MRVFYGDDRQPRAKSAGPPLGGRRQTFISMRPLAFFLSTLFFTVLARLAPAAPAFAAKWQEPNESIAVTTPAPAKMGVWWFDSGGLMRAAWQADVAGGDSVSILTLPAEGRWSALSGGRLEVFVYGSAAEPAVLAVEPAKGKAPPGRPMSHGTFVQDGQLPQRWHVDDDHTLNWDGEPWIPFGGMYCCPALAKNAKSMEERWEENREVLDQIQAAGFNDLYVNLTGGPQEVRQQMLDDFNRRGIRYGFQLPGSKAMIRGYLIRRNAAQGLIVGTCEKPGELRVRLPKDHLLGLLIVGPGESTSVQAVNEEINLAEANRNPGFIIIDEATDAKDKTVQTTLKIQGLKPGKYFVLPKAIVVSHAMDVWGREEELLKRIAWVKDLRWGLGLRFFVDPIYNEEGIYNQAEPVRAWTPAFNAIYAQWLESKYKSVGDLAKAWRLPAGVVKTFAEAARLVPLRDTEARWGKESIRWIDPDSLRLVSTVGGLGQGWLDYLEGVRETYADCRDQLAREIRKLVDVPVVFKRVTPWASREGINRVPGGFNGVGLELYPGTGSIVNNGLIAGAAEAQLASQTMWLLATEMGYDPRFDNGGVRGFPSEEYIENNVRIAARFGARGFMFFGWRLEPYDLWKVQQLHTMPEQLAWIANVRRRLLADWPKTVAFGQAFPEGQNWWWKAGGQPLTRYTAVLDHPASLVNKSVLLAPAGEDGALPPIWVASSTPVMPDAKLLLVNFGSRESAERYGPQVAQWIANGEKVVYLGTLPAGTRVPGLDAHFTGERFKIGGDDAQVVRLGPNDKVLAEQNGKPWAKRAGNVLVIARWSPAMGAITEQLPPSMADPKWIREFVAE